MSKCKMFIEWYNNVYLDICYRYIIWKLVMFYVSFLKIINIYGGKIFNLVKLWFLEEKFESWKLEKCYVFFWIIIKLKEYICIC